MTKTPSQEELDELIFKVLSIVRRKAKEGDATAMAIIEEACKELEKKSDMRD